MAHKIRLIPGKHHFRVVATVCEADEPCCVYTVAAEVFNVDDEYAAVDEFCGANTSTCMHSNNYILIDYYTEVIT